MKKLEFLNPALFKIHTNIEGYLDEENNLIQISGYYTINDWINVGFYIKPSDNISTTLENGNTITYLVYDLSTKKYNFTNSLNKLNINKLYFKLYVYNNKFYASTNDITFGNTTNSTANFALKSLSSNISLTSLYSLSSGTSEFAYNSYKANYSLTSNISLTALYSLSSDTSNFAYNSYSANFSKTSLYSLSAEFSNISNKSLSSNISLTSLYSLSSGTSEFAYNSYSSQYSLSSYYSYTTEYAKYGLAITDRINLTNATSDYQLLVNQEAIISFTNTTKVPLNIATSDGTMYEIYIHPSNPGGTSGATNNAIYLYPNNIIYSNAFVYADEYRDATGLNSTYTSYSAFRIGWAYSSIYCIITNKTVYKNIKGMYDIYGVNNTYPSLNIFSIDWRDTNTSWTSLGTIVFPQNTSGEIVIKRIV
jgi:hypothetical protein